MTYFKKCKFKVFSGAIICLKGIRNVVGSIYRGLTPPPVAIIENLLGVITNKVLGIAAELNIAEQLASGAKTIEELADVTQTKPERLLRLMRTLISLGFFKIDSKNRYRNNSASRFLLANHRQSMRDFVLMFSSPWIFDLAKYAKEVVVTGDSASQLSGSGAFFDAIHSDPKVGQYFDGAMENFCRTNASFLADSFDFSPFKKICDLGGGTGANIIEILQRYPHAQGVVYDLPVVAKKADANFAKHHLQQRAQGQGGDFFTSIPNDCDLFILQAVLHDWGDQSCQRILACVKRDAPKASILVIESTRPDNNQYDITKLVDIWTMLAVADGKERSVKEFTVLFKQVDYVIKTTYLLPNLLRVMRLDPVQNSQ